MKYPNIKSAKLTHDQISQAFGFANRKSFDRTSAHRRYMAGVEKIVTTLTEERRISELKFLVELERKEKTLRQLIREHSCTDRDGNQYVYMDDVLECIENVYPEIKS